MAQRPDAPDCLVLGAGIAGLLAAATLQENGLAVTVLDKGRGVGGRLATRRLSRPDGEARFDHGAQYFTARTPRFQALVDRWLAADVVVEWGRGFSTLEGARPDGRPRFIGARGMTDLPKYLARTLDVRLSTRVTVLQAGPAGWQVLTEDGRRFTAPGLVATPPVPQTLALLAAGDVRLPEPVQGALAGVRYAPCFAVLAVLDGPSALPPPGGLWPNRGSIAWLADNRQKGISPLNAVTIHASPEFSQAHLEADPMAIGRQLLAEAGEWLGARVLSFQVQRWRYSLPVTTHPERFLSSAEPAPIVFAGDAFAGPRVEGAALSGLAAAEWLLRHDERI